ncbi:MAG TPA: phosphatase PAP2 family protein [Tissierellaceae bacterium]|nr:phosphatase PAP2 family protein [Tissierellaceae bacterium]
MRNRKKLIFSTILLVVFAILGFSIRNSTEGILFDISILDLLHQSTNIYILNIMKIISLFGSWKILVPGLILLTIYLVNKEKYYEAKLLIFNIFGSFGVNFLLKLFFQRTRPIDYFRVTKSGLSFPSGHSMVTMSMWLAIAYLLTRFEKNESKKVLIKIGTGLFILLMGISRIYLGVHWPTDVVGGYIMGYIIFNISLLL